MIQTRDLAFYSLKPGCTLRTRDTYPCRYHAAYSIKQSGLEVLVSEVHSLGSSGVVRPACLRKGRGRCGSVLQLWLLRSKCFIPSMREGVRTPRISRKSCLAYSLPTRTSGQLDFVRDKPHTEGHHDSKEDMPLRLHLHRIQILPNMLAPIIPNRK